jgi:hypothetical protein
VPRGQCYKTFSSIIYDKEFINGKLFQPILTKTLAHTKIIKLWTESFITLAPGGDPINKTYWIRFTHSFCKLDRITIVT